MKSSTLLAIVFIFVSGMTVCRANLGESEARCITRYGAESDVQTDLGYRQVGDKAASFNVNTPSGALIVRVTFLRGLSCRESFSCADSSRGLTEDQMKGILNSQSVGLKWEKGRTVYRTGYGSAYATIDWLRSDGAGAKSYMSGKADSRSLSGQIDLFTKLYADAQHFYDKENGDN
jgi:hypothetical protein